MPPRVEFWSSTEYDAFMKGLLAALEAHTGWSCRERFFISNADYRRPRGRLAKLWLRVRMYILYPLYLVLQVLRDRQPTLRVVCTNTFYAPLLAAWAGRRAQPVVHLVYDLFPDALVESGRLARTSLLARLLTQVTAASFRAASLNIFLGERLRDHARTRFPELPREAVIPVGASAQLFADHPPQPLPPGQPLRLFYCGNLGALHDHTTVTRALTELAAEDPAVFAGLQVHFHATGSGYAHLKPALAPLVSQLPPDALKLESGLASAAWVAAMRAAPVALVTMTPGAGRVLFPSKTYSALAAGQAILAVAPADSDLADLVSTQDCGWRVEPGDVAGLKSLLRQLASGDPELLAKRRAAYRLGQGPYDVAALARHWADVLRPLIPQSPA